MNRFRRQFGIRAAFPFAQLRSVCTSAVACVMALTLSAPAAFAQQTSANRSSTFNVVPIVITGVTMSGGQLIAHGLVGTTAFETPITVTSSAAQEGECPILNLSLAPIHLSLLGLNVDTSAICLDITAIDGGGLLGDLLCAIANLLQRGQPLADVLSGLTAPQLDRLSAGLTQVLNQAVFARLTSSDALQQATCTILNLALGPIDLNLLGLRVELDDCADGPVVLLITATEGGLLGDLLGGLLCNLSDLLNGNGSPAAILAVLRRIAIVYGVLLA